MQPTTEPDSKSLPPLQEAIEQTCAQAREQLTAAWQIHVARVEEQLRAGWRDNLAALLDERFQALTAEIEARIRIESEQAAGRERAAASRAVTEHINQAARRLRQSEKQEEWASAILDAAAAWSSRAALFTIQGRALRLEKASFASEPVEATLDAAPAFASVVDSGDPVVAVLSPSELSEPVTTAFGSAPGGRVHLFPLVSHGRTVAVLYAEASAPGPDANALEVIALLGAAVWELRSAPRGSSLVAIEAARKTAPAWSELPSAEQEVHLKAQRFARVQVAEMRLYQSAAVKQGRADRSLYKLLGPDIDRGREAYRGQFLGSCASMVDYYHVELVRTLANDDATLLGPDYPGPLV